MPSRSFVRQVSVVLACVATATAILSLYGQALNVDASAFLVVARGWLAGTSPYSGLWDHKPPGIYVVGAVAGLLDRHGDAVLAFRALSVTTIVATSLVLGRVVQRLTGRGDAGTAAALLSSAVLACPALSEGGGLSELFATTGLAVALWGVIESRTGSRGAAFVGGLGLGWAVSCSLLSLGILPALAWTWLYAAADAAPGHAPGLAARLRLGSLAWLVAGGATLALAFLVALALSGSLPAAVTALVEYNGVYRSLAIFEPGQWLLGPILLLPFLIPALAMVALIRAADQKLATGIALAWLGGGLAWLLYGERFYPHYLLVLAPPLVILTILAALRCANPSRPTWRVTTGAFICLVVVAVAEMILGAGDSSVPEAQVNRSVADYIDSSTPASAPIYVWGESPDIYLSADRMPAGRYFYLLPLMTPGFGEAAAGEMLRSWQADPPQIVVDASFGTAGHAALAPLLVDHPVTTEDRRTGSSGLDDLRAFVRGHYELAFTAGDKRVYRYHG